MPSMVIHVDRNEVVRKGEEIYEKIRSEVESKHYGKIIVIEVESGK